MFGIRRCNQKNLKRAPDLLRGAKSGEETMKKAWLISAALLLTFAASEAIAIQPPASCEDQGGRVINVPIVAAINGHRIPVPNYVRYWGLSRHPMSVIPNRQR